MWKTLASVWVIGFFTITLLRLTTHILDDAKNISETAFALLLAGGIIWHLSVIADRLKRKKDDDAA